MIKIPAMLYNSKTNRQAMLKSRQLESTKLEGYNTQAHTINRINFISGIFFNS